MAAKKGGLDSLKAAVGGLASRLPFPKRTEAAPEPFSAIEDDTPLGDLLSSENAAPGPVDRKEGRERADLKALAASAFGSAVKSTPGLIAIVVALAFILALVITGIHRRLSAQATARRGAVDSKGRSPRKDLAAAARRSPRAEDRDGTRRGGAFYSRGRGEAGNESRSAALLLASRQERRGHRRPLRDGALMMRRRKLSMAALLAATVIGTLSCATKPAAASAATAAPGAPTASAANGQKPEAAAAAPALSRKSPRPRLRSAPHRLIPKFPSRAAPLCPTISSSPLSMSPCLPFEQSP